VVSLTNYEVNPFCIKAETPAGAGALVGGLSNRLAESITNETSIRIEIASLLRVKAQSTLVGYLLIDRVVGGEIGIKFCLTLCHLLIPPLRFALGALENMLLTDHLPGVFQYTCASFRGTLWRNQYHCISFLASLLTARQSETSISQSLLRGGRS